MFVDEEIIAGGGTNRRDEEMSEPALFALRVWVCIEVRCVCVSLLCVCDGSPDCAGVIVVPMLCRLVCVCVDAETEDDREMI